jgi:hypothetical protein
MTLVTIVQRFSQGYEGLDRRFVIVVSRLDGS